MKDDDTNDCEGCGEAPWTTHDADGLKLCKECYEACPLEDEDDDPENANVITRTDEG